MSYTANGVRVLKLTEMQSAPKSDKKNLSNESAIEPLEAERADEGADILMVKPCPPRCY